MDNLKKIGNIPFGLGVLQSLYPDCRHISDKAIRLEAEERIIRLKKGLYVSRPENGEVLSLQLVANHIYGPSYVSMSSALRWYGMIPERVELVQSVTTKHSRDFCNTLGSFRYQNCSAKYFPIGVTMQGKGNVRFLIATPEKALCDYINFNKVSLRFIKDVGPFLEEDLRIDTDMLGDLDPELIRLCAENGRKSGSLYSLLKFLQHDRHL